LRNIIKDLGKVKWRGVGEGGRAWQG